jgi:general stress protein 26
MSDKLRTIIDAHGAGILASMDAEGKPHVRWLTPVIFPSRPGTIYALTVPVFPKVGQLRASPFVEWLFQTPSLSEVVTVRGRIVVVDNPSLRSQVLEAIGKRLFSLWKLTHDARDLAVLETEIEEATYYKPMEGSREAVSFGRQGSP